MICGLSRETVVGLVANLESRLIRQTEYVGRKIAPEHPRSSSTDDVEGFFSLLHEMFGPVFDLKQFYDECPKILQEFKKRIDVDLPFFYWTGTKQRFTDFDLPSFNKSSGPGIVERLDKIRISKRGDPVFLSLTELPSHKKASSQHEQSSTRHQWHCLHHRQIANNSFQLTDVSAVCSYK